MELAGESFDILRVIFDKIRGLRIPVRIAVTAHIDGHNVILRVEVSREMVERMRDPADAVQQDQRLFVRSAPIDVMDPKTVDGHITIGGLCMDGDRGKDTGEYCSR